MGNIPLRPGPGNPDFKAAPAPAPQAVDETALFIVEPDGWYGMLSLRSPFIRRLPGQYDDETHWLNSKYGQWLPRLLTETNGLTWVSCVPVTQCWYNEFSKAERNDYALTMLKSVAVNMPSDVCGPVVFTGQGSELGAPVGLRPEQLEPIAAAYRIAQKKLA